MRMRRCERFTWQIWQSADNQEYDFDYDDDDDDAMEDEAGDVENQYYKAKCESPPGIRYTI